MSNHDVIPSRRRRRGVATIAAGAVALLAALLLGGSAQAVTPTTVLLGNATSFAILAGSGITNSGASTIAGDTGSNPTPTETGFAACPAANCVTQVGVNHTTADTATGNAKNDLTTAFNDAAGRTSTPVITELAGQTLVAGVYSAASTTFGMTGTLTLDGANNADSVFIFQAPGGLTTAGTANVVLENGAQACNVFWEVGVATLNGGSFTGTLMSSSSITLSGPVTVAGRLLAGEQGAAGAVTLINDTITTPSACVTQASIDSATAAAAAAAQAAAAQAAAAAVAAQAAVDQAAAAQAAAATVAAQTAATTTAALTATTATTTAAQAAQVAATKATAAVTAATRAATAARVAAKQAAIAKVASAKAAAAKAAAAAKRAAAHATVARLAAARAATARVKAARAASVLRAKIATAKRNAATTSSAHAQKARAHVAVTG